MDIHKGISQVDGQTADTADKGTVKTGAEDTQREVAAHQRSDAAGCCSLLLSERHGIG